MRNEMGNNNTSEIIKEEDKATDVVVKTENHLSPEALGAGLMSSSSDDTKPLEESSELIEKVKGDTAPAPEPEPDSQFPRILTEGKEDTMPEPELDFQFPPELCNPACVHSDFSVAASTNVSQVCISKEMNTEEVEDSGEDKSAKTTSQIHGTGNDPDKIHEKIQTLPLILHPDSPIEDEIHLEENEEDFVQEQSDPQEEKVLEIDTISEESEFLAYIESENEADSIKKTEIHQKIDDLTVSVKEIDKQSMFPDLHNVCQNIEEVSTISPLTITTTEMIDQITLGTAAETEETLSKQSNEENAIVETSQLVLNCSDQELVEEVVIRSKGEKKSPSFDFDIPLVILKSVESVQTTPLLHHDKNIASRSSSFSGYSSNILINEREGIIRSDSVVSRCSLIKRDEDVVNVEYVQERKESHYSDEKNAIDEFPVVVEELALTKQKGRGNRKPKSLLFSTCICCTANFD